VGHGAVAFATALVFYVLHQPASDGGVGMAVLPAALLSVALFAPLLGLLLDRFLFRRLTDTPEATRLVGAVGVLIAFPPPRCSPSRRSTRSSGPGCRRLGEQGRPTARSGGRGPPGRSR